MEVYTGQREQFNLVDDLPLLFQTLRGSAFQ